MVCDIKVLKDICPIPPLNEGEAKKLNSKSQSACSIHSKANVGPSKKAMSKSPVRTPSCKLGVRSTTISTETFGNSC
ncbi:Uncharacterised protein [Acinetobacter baumannii]|nr:Uncharacterised protein [Acinetobacter baumannii]SSS12175.1 Uncharacterised protein [Acinetobacter baumannii]